jgi:hypothetical protein
MEKLNNTKKLLISVHLPKTAGTSFGVALEGLFGDRLLRDYGDTPLQSDFRYPSIVGAGYLSGVDCIHGHFMPMKYMGNINGVLPPRNLVFVTWMRNPVDRVISHYHYWRRNYSRKIALSTRRKMYENDWSLERFCLGPELRNLYTRYITGFELNRFSFVGITEHFEEDLTFFASNYLPQEIDIERLNVGNIRGTYNITKSFRKEIEKVHSNDMLLYFKALELRSSRISRF